MFYSWRDWGGLLWVRHPQMHASVKAFKVPFTSLCKHSLRKANLDADVKSWPSVQKAQSWKCPKYIEIIQNWIKKGQRLYEPIWNQFHRAKELPPAPESHVKALFMGKALEGGLPGLTALTKAPQELPQRETKVTGSATWYHARAESRCYPPSWNSGGKCCWPNTLDFASYIYGP